MTQHLYLVSYSGICSVRVIKENFGIKHGCITTVHDVTATQVCCVMIIRKINMFVCRRGACVLERSDIMIAIFSIEKVSQNDFNSRQQSCDVFLRRL